MAVKIWTYGGDPANSNRDAVRFHVGDTNPNDKLLDDREVDYLLSTEGAPIDAAIAACLGLAALYAREYEDRIGGREKSTKPHEHFLKLADVLRQKRARKTVVPFVGGLTITDKETRSGDTDQVRPAFRRDLHVNHYRSPTEVDPCR